MRSLLETLSRGSLLLACPTVVLAAEGFGSDHLPPEEIAMRQRAFRSPVARIIKEQTAPQSSALAFNSDQGPGPGPLGPGPGCNLFPAPPSVGASLVRALAEWLSLQEIIEIQGH